MTYPPQPPQYQSFEPLQPPRKAKHMGRRIVLGIGGSIIALIIVAVAFGSHVKAPAPTASPKAAAVSASPSLVALTAPQRKFVGAVRAALTAHGATSPASDAAIAVLATQVCAARQAGSSQATLVTASSSTGAKFDLSPAAFVAAAEADVCPQYIPVAQTITYIVTGSGADVTYGPSGTDLAGTVPMSVTKPLGSPSYYAISAQLQGAGDVKCAIEVDGKTIATGEGSGGYNIAQCEISPNPLTGAWEDTNSG